MSELESAARAVPPDAAPVVFYGSSSIRLWDTLAADLPGVPTLNLGFGGSTLAACARYFERLVVRRRPRAVLLYAGDNDLGNGRSPEDVLDAFRDLAAQSERLLGPTPLAFLSIKPSPARWAIDAQIRRANELVRAETEARPACEFLDVYPRMLGPDGMPRRELYADDGLHLSKVGYGLWAAFLRGGWARRFL